MPRFSADFLMSLQGMANVLISTVLSFRGLLFAVIDISSYLSICCGRLTGTFILLHTSSSSSLITSTFKLTIPITPPSTLFSVTNSSEVLLMLISPEFSKLSGVELFISSLCCSILRLALLELT